MTEPVRSLHRRHQDTGDRPPKNNYSGPRGTPQKGPCRDDLGAGPGAADERPRTTGRRAPRHPRTRLRSAEVCAPLQPAAHAAAGARSVLRPDRGLARGLGIRSPVPRVVRTTCPAAPTRPRPRPTRHRGRTAQKGTPTPYQPRSPRRHGHRRPTSPGRTGALGTPSPLSQRQLPGPEDGRPRRQPAGSPRSPRAQSAIAPGPGPRGRGAVPGTTLRPRRFRSGR